MDLREFQDSVRVQTRTKQCGTSYLGGWNRGCESRSWRLAWVLVRPCQRHKQPKHLRPMLSTSPPLKLGADKIQDVSCGEMHRADTSSVNVNHPQDTSRTSCLRPMGTIKPLPLKPHSHEAQRDNKAFLWPQCDYWQCRCTDQCVQTLPTAASSWCLQPMNSLLQPRLPDNFPLCCGGTPSESPAFLSTWLHACPFFIPSLCQSGFQDQVTQDITVFCILLN